jgi:hypothetical protein
MRIIPCLGAVFAISCALPAQTFIVDANNGPGANFLDIQQAINAVPNGAILLVRPGSNYSPIVVNAKALSILAIGPGVVINTAWFQEPVVVTNLPAGQSFTMRGLSENGSLNTNRCRLSDCQGMVLVDDWTSLSNLSNPGINRLTAQAIVVERCAHVTLRNCHLRGQQGLHALDSDVVVENCDLSGHDASQASIIVAATGIGAVIEGGTTTFARCRVQGGNGLPTSANPGPAIYAVNALIRLCEDGSGVYAAGTSPVVPTPAIDGSNSTVVRGPQAVLTGSNGGSAVAATLVDVVRPLPSLRTISAPPGGVVHADVTTPVGELVMLALALPGPVLPVPGIDGTFRLDPATAAVVALGVPQSSAPVTHAIAVPNTQAMVGALWAWQAVAWSAADGLRVSNPSIYAH